MRPTTRLSRVRIARPFGGTQDRRDQPAPGVEVHDWLETVLVVVGVEQLKLLGAMGGIEGIIQIEHDAVRNLRDRGAVLVDQRHGHAIEIRARRQVLEPGHRRLRTQVLTLLRQAAQGDLEDR